MEDENKTEDKGCKSSGYAETADAYQRPSMVSVAASFSDNSDQGNPQITL